MGRNTTPLYQQCMVPDVARPFPTLVEKHGVDPNADAEWNTWRLKAAMTEGGFVTLLTPGEYQVEDSFVPRVPIYVGPGVVFVTSTGANVATLNGWVRGLMHGPRAPTLCIAGTSIESAHQINVPPNYANGARGPINWALMKAKWPLSIVNNCAQGGTTSPQVRQSLREGVFPFAPGYCLIGSGFWNDGANGVAVSQTIAENSLAILELLSMGITPIVAGLHASLAFSSASARRNQAKVNNALKDLVRLVGGRFVDTWSVTFDIATGGAKASITQGGGDDLHLTAFGAQFLGEGPYFEALASMGLVGHPAMLNPADAENLSNNPFLIGANATGTNGWVRTGWASGNGPNALSADLSSTTGTISNTAARSDGRAGNVLTLNAAFSALHGWGRVSHSVRWGVAYTAGTYTVGAWRIPTTPNGCVYAVHAITTGSTAGGDPTGSWSTTPGDLITDGGITWKCFEIPQVGQAWMCEWEAQDIVIGGAGGIVVPTVTMQDSAGATIGTAYANYFESTNPQEVYPAASAGTAIYRTPRFVLPSGCVWMTPQFRVQGPSGGTVVAGLNSWRLRRVP